MKIIIFSQMKRISKNNELVLHLGKPLYCLAWWNTVRVSHLLHSSLPWRNVVLVKVHEENSHLFRQLWIFFFDTNYNYTNCSFLNEFQYGIWNLSRELLLDLALWMDFCTIVHGSFGKYQHLTMHIFKIWTNFYGITFKSHSC